MAALSALLVLAVTRRVMELMAQPGLVVPFVAALAYGLGTSVWSTASQGLWSHTPTLLGYVLGLWALLAGWWGWAGVAVVASVLARPATAPAAAALVAYTIHVAWRRTRPHAAPEDRRIWSRVATCCAGGLIVGLLGVTYNLWIFGNAVGGAPVRTEFWVRQLGAPTCSLARSWRAWPD